MVHFSSVVPIPVQSEERSLPSPGQAIAVIVTACGNWSVIVSGAFPVASPMLRAWIVNWPAPLGVRLVSPQVALTS